MPPEEPQAIPTVEAQQNSHPKRKNPECIICKNPHLFISRVGIRENPNTPVYQCPRCLIQFIDSPLEDIRDYYKKQYRQEHDCTIGKKMTPEERFKMVYPSMIDVSETLHKFIPKGASILEIGCSSGYLLAHLRGDYDLYGNEWNAEDAKYVRDVGEIPCEEGVLEEIYPGKSFTAIVAIAVLEHQPDPLGFLRQCKKRLIGGGYLYLEVPNAQEMLVTGIDVPEFVNRYYRECHITYWQLETMVAVLGALGFEAEVSIRQRYGLVNHVSWTLAHQPMKDYSQATEFMDLLPEKHPLHDIMFRHTSKLDREYRLLMETLKAADTITARCRLRYI